MTVVTGSRVRNVNTGEYGTVIDAGTYLGDGDFRWSVKLDRPSRLLKSIMRYWSEAGMRLDWELTDVPYSPISYHARMAAPHREGGDWAVYIEKVDAERPKVDSWGNGPIFIHTVAKDIPSDKDYDTGGLASSYQWSTQPPFAAQSAMRKAERMAARLNDHTDDLTIERLRELLANH